MKLTDRAESAYRLQSYEAAAPIEGVSRVELRRFHDDGGSMTELLRLASDPPPGLEGFRVAQMNYSVLQPGVVKAFHLHRKQTDVWFVPPEDRVLLVLQDLREGSATCGETRRMVLGDGRSALVRIPPGVAHGCRNIGADPARIVYFTDRLFSADPASCDEGRLPWDFAGKDVWDISWE